VPARFFRLRWRFEYSDGKPPRVGVWDGATTKDADGAWAVDKTNLAYAIIEAEDRTTFEVRRALVVEGAAYASSQWEAYARAGNALAIRHAVTPRVHVAGLSFLTQEEKISVLVNGTVTRRPLTDYEKRMNIHEHKLGS
jgi:hypothetical protein